MRHGCRTPMGVKFLVTPHVVTTWHGRDEFRCDEDEDPSFSSDDIRMMCSEASSRLAYDGRDATRQNAGPRWGTAVLSTAAKRGGRTYPARGS